METRKVGVCVAGLGNFGKRLLVYLQKLDCAQVVSLYHPDPLKAKALGPLGISDLQAAIEDSRVGCFVVATPPDRHFDLLRQVLSHGRKHVFVEKPLTERLQTALDILPLVESAKGLVFMVGHQQRRESRFRKAKEAIQDGVLGKVVSVEINFSHGAAYSVSPKEWRWSASRHPSGPLLSLGSHSIDTVHYLFGPARSVFARISNLSGRTEAPDSSAVLLELESGAAVTLQSNYNVPSEKKCTVYGTEGVLYIDRDTVALRPGRDRDKIPSQATPLALSGLVDPIKEELAEFFTAILQGGSIETGYRGALDVMAVLEACNRSSAEGRPVPMSEFSTYFQISTPPR